MMWNSYLLDFTCDVKELVANQLRLGERNRRDSLILRLRCSGEKSIHAV